MQSLNIVFAVVLVIALLSFISFLTQYTLMREMSEAFITVQKFQTISCDHSKPSLEKIPFQDTQARIQHFYNTAHSLDPVTDKVMDHSYQIMYGQYLLPYYQAKPNMKLLEIGLGCDMHYGPGASVALWKKLFPQADIWEAEYNDECVAMSKEKGQLDGIHTLVGDQGDNATLDRWIEESNGADFDIVIDDGGHLDCQVYNSFMKLWPKLKEGGLYFMEDLQVGRMPFFTCDGYDAMVDVIAQWNEQLLLSSTDTVFKVTHPLPIGVKFIMCQWEACVIGKREPDE